MSANLVDEAAFRDRARNLALDQVAVLLNQFLGLERYDVQFDVLAVTALRTQLAQTLSKFILETPLYPVPEGLVRVLEEHQDQPMDRYRQADVRAERKRLEEAGL